MGAARQRGPGVDRPDHERLSRFAIPCRNVVVPSGQAMWKAEIVGRRIIDRHVLVKRFDGLVAFDSIDCRIDRQEILGFIGPNRSGRSTLIDIPSGAI